ncbi:hypothetical protein RND71_022279 [Anisodus tanguticus]|uniref:Uncharacterized protein n=1 Tax=Anisodus tanguticus TaxID=243964 RepID=A0AAE1RY90_9SOLA|nr:hypothetical protein RND71_022279 [Anisodus tanguticus]
MRENREPTAEIQSTLPVIYTDVHWLYITEAWTTMAKPQQPTIQRDEMRW